MSEERSNGIALVCIFAGFIGLVAALLGFGAAETHHELFKFIDSRSLAAIGAVVMLAGIVGYRKYKVEV